MVKYEGTTYSRRFTDNGRGSTVIDSIPCVVKDDLEIIETEEYISLVYKTFEFNIVNHLAHWTPTEDIPVMQFVKSTQEWEINEEEVSVGSNYYKLAYKLKENDFSSSPMVTEVICRALAFLNPYLGNKLLQHRCDNFSNYTINLMKLTTSQNADKADKILSAMGYDYFSQQLSDEDGLRLDEGRKLHQIIALPIRILEYIKQSTGNYRSPNLEKNFRILCEKDENEGLAVLDYFDKLSEIKVFRSFKENRNSEGDFISGLAKAKYARPDISIRTLIGYLVKQRLFYGMMQFEVGYRYKTDFRAIFELPVDYLRTYNDYLNMVGKTGELYPRVLQAAHNVAVRNVRITKDANLAKRFATAVRPMAKYEYADDENFLVTYPHSVEELVAEGNALNHCVATYASSIAAGDSIVLFVRKTDDPDTPFVTIEVDGDDLVPVQIKGDFDIDVTDPDVLDFIKKWRKKKKGV